MLYALAAFLHAVFIVLIVVSVGLEKKIFINVVKIILAALILCIPIFLFGYLDEQGSSYVCADGNVVIESVIPLLQIPFELTTLYFLE